LEERRVLDVLSVAGGAMDMDLLHTVLEISEMSLIRLIDTLIERTYVIEPRSRNEPELSLPHGLYTEVIYQTLPKSRKRIYHRRIAEELAVIGKDKLENAALIAHHAVLGEDFNRAVKAYNDAGWYGLKVYVPQQAELYFSRAFALIKNLPELRNTSLNGEILFGLAECQRLSGKYEEAMDGYSRSMSLLPAVLKQAAVHQAFQLNLMTGAELQNFEELAIKLETDLISDGNSWALALLYWGQAFSALTQGKVNKTILLNRNGWRVARDLIYQGESFPPWIWQRAYTLLARMHIQWGNFYTAHKIVNCLIHHAEETGQQNNLASAKIWFGEVCLNLSQYSSAQEAFLSGLKIAEKANDPRLCGEAQLGLGRVCFEKEEFDEAAVYADQVLAVSEENKDILRQMNATILKAKINLGTNQTVEALPGLMNLLMLAKYLRTSPYVVQLLTVLVQIYIKTGKEKEAFELLLEAIPLAEQCGLKQYIEVLKQFQSVLQKKPGKLSI
jgi:tetratricopeptide (TPR) repeat protein